MSKYFPPAGEWARQDPVEAGFDPARLEAAVRYAVESEIDWPIDVSRMVGRNDPPPYDEILGPAQDRGPAAGLVIRDGYLVAEWGDPGRVDMTFSATKSYLSVTVGLARDRGMLGSMDEPMRERIADGGFDSEHNARITWKHMLQMTSEWQGTLFDRPDSVDYHRDVQGTSVSTGEADSATAVGGSEQLAAEKGSTRELRAPGSFWEYNDVRVNRLALSALRIWKEPLPEVLRREVMDPIGASSEWTWHPYENSWVDVEGVSMPSVPGGGHWGGGLFISALDHARFGLLMLNRGEWNGRRLLSEAWIEESLTPSEVSDRYGYLWWLNTGQQLYSGAPASAFAAQGAGGNIVFVDPEHDLVVVTRWAGDRSELVNRVIAALD
ncbi:MAG: serine hydrolase [Chloroflexi bacterium]|nr:serine hydrolase [Chloroflexota bacterium]MDA1145377.1 serine hydrolase [Chloroflexota bacterium]